jgi:hypothetical protein
MDLAHIVAKTISHSKAQQGHGLAAHAFGLTARVEIKIALLKGTTMDGLLRNHFKDITINVNEIPCRYHLELLYMYICQCEGTRRYTYHSD